MAAELEPLSSGLEAHSPSAWVVEDDLDASAILSRWLINTGVRPRSFESGAALLSQLKESSGLPDVICLDLALPDFNGLDLLAEIQRSDSALPVVVITSNESVEAITRAIRLGAYEYLSKTCDQTRFRTTIHRAIEHRKLNQQLALLGRSVSGQHDLGILGQSRPVEQLISSLTSLARADVPVLITGETGTGKELAARAIHQLSERSKGPFIAINCAALPANILESELFGHEKGAFTGAVGVHKGVFERAHGGVLFLDEIGELPAFTQAKLLRVIQEQRFHRLGGTTEIRSDFRLITATNRDIQREITEGAFRADLYYRIAVGEVDIPPLRARKEDIRLLSQYFVRNYGAKLGSIPTIAEETYRILEEYSWPGNIRELRHAVEAAAIVCNDSTILPSHLPQRLFAAVPIVEPPLEQPTTLEEHERRALSEALIQHNGNVSAAARSLNIGRATFYRKIKRFGLQA